MSHLLEPVVAARQLKEEIAHALRVAVPLIYTEPSLYHF